MYRPDKNSISTSIEPLNLNFELFNFELELEPGSFLFGSCSGIVLVGSRL